MIDLEFNHVSKMYRVRADEPTADNAANPWQRKLQRLRRRSEDFWAVRDVSFQVKRGEVLGIIGHNGAGKSTILKLISSITAPTSGEIKINGRLAALIEVGSGFHPELSGRENIFLSGSILGMRRREIAAKLDRIVEFAGVRQFIDTPVKRYSSGMYVRLGFAIAAHLDPDILLLDEVLAVGDSAFQKKCFERIGELRQAGTSIVFISHDLNAVERLCSRVILMQRGQIAAEGEPAEVIVRYNEMTLRKEEEQTLQPEIEIEDHAPEVTITNFEIFGADGESRRTFEFGEEVRIKIDLHAARRIEAPLINFGLVRADGVIVCNFNNRYDNFKVDFIEGDCTLEGWLPPLRLIPHAYEIHVLVYRRDSTHIREDVTQMLPLACDTFGSLRIHGVALNVHDGVFQQPASKWRLTRDDCRLEHTDIGPDALFETYRIRQPQVEADAVLVER